MTTRFRSRSRSGCHVAVIGTCAAILLGAGSVSITRLKTEAPKDGGAHPVWLETVNAFESKRFSYAGAELYFPAGAVESTVTIGVRPLTASELPDMDAGISNVTPATTPGYRFTPRGSTFKKAVAVTLPYDPELIPNGYTAEDVHTFYYDELSETWIKLQRVKVDLDRQVIISTTDHFTNMINGTVSVPDHPTPVSFNPTSIKDIKAADPGAQINLIAEPRPNNFGAANLHYPIQVPPGRDGMEPQLDVVYNSAGENGWMGLGWNLSMASIVVDTRWGVARYDDAQETETYMLGGEQLTPGAHRGALQARAPEKQFHTRVEGRFLNIMRHGDHPSNYWWEVIDKEGTRFFYGGDPEVNGPASDSTLSDPVGGSEQNIYKWALREVRDTNGNIIRYKCVRVQHPGLEGGSVPGTQLYLDEIRYTGFGATDGPYAVKFLREQGRPDVMIDCRGGFKMVTADRLTQIDVTFDNALVRRYRFAYEVGAFEQSRLLSISQYGENDEHFNTHTFEYFDETATDTANVLNGFAATSAFDDAEIVSGDGLLLHDVDSSAFEADVTDSQQTEGSAGISLAGVIGFGGRASTGSGTSVNYLTLVDINGDTLPDQLYQSDGEFYFRPNTGGPASAPDFGTETPLPTLSAISLEDSQTRTYGGDVTFGITVSGEVARTTTRGRVYLTDVNGDLLPDLVVNGEVYYNRLEDGVPTFGLDSPVPLTPGAPTNAEGLVEDPSEDREEQERAFHLVDPVRRWVAPFSGTVSVSGSVRLAAAPPATYTTADGIRASIQHNASELWSETIDDPEDLSARTIAGLDAIGVSAGDRLYFRVNSLYDGAYDEVEFAPTITYTGAVDTSLVDENGMPIFVYDATTDYSYGGRPLIFNAPVNGSAMVTGHLIKSATTTDDITLQILKGPNLASLVLMHEHTVAWDQTGSFPVVANVDTVLGEFLQMRIQTDSRIDLSAVRFAPTEIARGFLPEGGLNADTCADEIDNDGNGVADADDPTCLEGASLVYSIVDGNPAPQFDNGEPALAFNIPVTIQAYPRNAFTTPYVPYQAPEDGTVDVHWPISTTVFTSNLTTTVTLTIKRAGQRLAKQTVAIVNGIVSGPSALNATIDVSQGDELYFEADAGSALDIGDFLLQINVMNPVLTYTIPPGFPSSTGFDLHLGPDDTDAFGGGFRQWGYGQYNGDFGQGEGGDLPSTCSDGLDNDDNGLTDREDPLCALPIAESQLVVPVSDNDPVIDVFLQMVPFVERDQWRAQDEEAWISAERMSASRLGVNFLDFPDGSKLGGGRGIVRLGGAKTTSENLSLLGFGVGSSSGTNWSAVEFLDFNGDRYPDVVGGGEVQPTLPNGALAADRIVVGGFGRVRKSDSETCNINLGATITRQVSNSRGRVESITTEKPAYNLSAGVTGGRGDFNTHWDLLDINGDGLPDYVTRTGSGLRVRLNLGYRFAAEEDWDSTSQLRREQSVLKGLSVGVGFTTPSYGLGGGVSHTASTSSAFYDLIDVNGDGLLDAVSKDLNGNPLADLCIPVDLASGSTELTVRFNTGNRFTEPYVLTGAMAMPLRTQVSITRNIGANGSVGIPIGPVILSFGGGHSRSRSLGGFEITLRDFNGDGYADHLYSDTTGEVQVNLNVHGRTNLLRTIRRPLGAVITLDYARDGNTVDLPQTRWNLSRVDVFDGFCGDGVDTLVSTYEYLDGFYDRTEREFYGYQTVIERQLNTPAGDAVYRSITSTYSNNNYYNKSLLIGELIQDAAGNRFTEVRHSFVLIDISTGMEVADPQSTTATVFPQLVRTDRLFYEGLAIPGKTTYTTFAYDAVGNMTAFFDAADEGIEDDLSVALGYFSDPAAYIVGIPNHILVSSNGVEMRRREADVEPGTGNILQVRQFLADGAVATTDLQYYPNGNLLSAIGPPNLHGQRYAVALEYDAATATHMTSISDSFGYVSTSTHDLRFGRPDVTTDINGNATDHDYDAFGRITSITGPYETGGLIPTLRFEYHPDQAAEACPNQPGVRPWALTRHIDPFRDVNDPIDTVLFSDGLKRVLQTKKDCTIHSGADDPAEHVMMVSGRLTYDHVGRTVEHFYPTTEPLGTPGEFNPAYDSIVPTTTEYDVLDRITNITIPDNTSSSTSYGFGPDRSGTPRFETTVTDANGIEKRTYHDVRKLITAMREANDGGAQILWTSYGYDAIKQLVQVEDDHHNISVMSYDNFGRRTAIDSPDAGLTENDYDLAGNLIAKVTANLRALNLQISYDHEFNRLLTVAYPLNPDNNVAYTYGSPGAPFNRAGRIVTVASEAGTVERFYGKLGEVTKELKTIASDTQGNSPNSPEVYTTQYTYDTWNRLQELTYPDGEVLTYDYDSGGLVRAATGFKDGVVFPYLERLEYDKFEQRVFMQCQNGVRTTQEYDPLDRRLLHLVSGTTGNTPFQDLHYTYDDVGNILQIHNDVPVPASNRSGGPVVQTYAYDDLYRLTEASGVHQYGPNKSSQYAASMSYDTIHNITAKNQLHELVRPSGQTIVQSKTSYAWAYQFDGPQPHAPTHIGDRTYSYDANGNQLGWEHDTNGTSRTILWDEENRIQSVYDNGHEKTYKYDDGDQRVIKRGPQGETAYVNPFYTVRNGTVITKHVYAETTRVASKLTPGHSNPQNNHGNPESNFLYFYHPDHLGSSSYVTTINGKLFEHLQYFPSGETWVQEKSNTQHTPYLYSAKELDEETGLYYYGARYYDPRTSVWQSPDPLFMDRPARGIREPQFYNLYAFAQNNPVKFIDPNGLDVIIAVGADPKKKKNEKTWMATAKALKAAIRKSNPKVRVRITSFKKLGKTARSITRKNGKVSTLVYIGHGSGGGQLMPSGLDGSEYVTLQDATKSARVARDGAVVALACFVGDSKLKTSGFKKKRQRVYATPDLYEWLYVKGKEKPKARIFSHKIDLSGDPLGFEERDAYKSVTNVTLPEQTGLKKGALTIPKAALQAEGRVKDD